MSDCTCGHDHGQPDYYLVPGDIYRNLTEDDVDVPTDIGEYDHWYDGERDYLALVLGILGLQLLNTGRILRQTVQNPVTYPQLEMKIDMQFNDVLWKNRPPADKFIEKFYDVGKRDAYKGFNVTTIYDASDNHALWFAKHYNYDMIMGLSDDMRMNIKRAIWEGVGQGRSMPQIAKTIERTAIKSPLVIRNKRTGKVLRTLSPQQRALMIARTETMRAVNQGQLIGYMQNGITSLMINTAGDRRVCPHCLQAAREGPYPIDRVIYLPRHPLCRCTYSADPEALLKPPFYNLLEMYPNMVTGQLEQVFPIPKGLVM